MGTRLTPPGAEGCTPAPAGCVAGGGRPREAVAPAGPAVSGIVFSFVETPPTSKCISGVTRTERPRGPPRFGGPGHAGPGEAARSRNPQPPRLPGSPRESYHEG